METTKQDILRDVELTISYTFNAPRELVWDFWTDADLVKEWWGPSGYTAPFTSIDFRVGGECLYCMRSPDGKDIWSKGVYQEIIAPEKFIVTDSFSDEKGNLVHGSFYGMPEDFPEELLITVTLEDQGDKTRMILKHQGVPAGEMSQMTEQGWKESFDKLEVALEKCRE